jgi:hypothetical protein
MVLLDPIESVVDDREAVREDVDEDEREDPDREHRERDPSATAEKPHAPDRQAQEDRQAGESAEGDGLCEGQVT